MLIKVSSALALLALPLAVYATEYRTVERPRQECWNEQVPVQSAGSNYGGALVGGIAGGILGNQVGGGNGKTIATAVGAMTGALVGDRMSSGAPSYQVVRRCRTVFDQVQVPVVREPVQVIREPVFVVEQPVYYVGREEEHREYWRHRQHEHRHHEHDDDEDLVRHQRGETDVLIRRLKSIQDTGWRRRWEMKRFFAAPAGTVASYFMD